MGVPKLFAWLTKKYPQIIFDKNLDNIDNFFLILMALSIHVLIKYYLNIIILLIKIN